MPKPQLAELNQNESSTNKLYFEAQDRFTEERNKFISGDGSALDYLEAEIAFDTAQLKYNETGALIADSNEGLLIELFIGTKDTTINEQTGAISINKDDYNKTLLKTTLPSLAQINSAENHEGGNRALSTTVDILEKADTSISPVVFHQRGGDFLVGFDTDNPNAAEHHIANIEAAKWQKIKGTNDEPYLLAETVSLGEALEAFNRIQVLKSIISPVDVLTHQMDIEKEVFNIGIDLLNYKLEYRKCKEMCFRFWEDLTQSNSTEDKNKEVYFNSYLKSYFQPIGVNSLEEMVTLVRNNPTLVIDTVADKRAIDTLDLKENILRGSILRKYLNTPKQADLGSTDISTINTTKEEGGLIEAPIDELISYANSLGREFKNERVGENEAINFNSLKPPTEHNTLAYQEFYSAWNKTKNILEKGLNNNILEANDVISLIDLAALEIDISIADVNFNAQEKILAELGNPIRGKNVKRFAHLINQRYLNFYNRLDSLTAIPNRESFYRETSERIFRSLSTDTPISLTMIDLAFLNYYNRIGNRATGDIAINHAFKQLETSLDTINMDSALPAQLYRYAGDEKIITTEGKEQQAEEILLNLNATGKPVPVAGKYAFEYIPVGIQYNFGSANIFTAEECFESTILEQNPEMQGIANVRRPLRAVYMIENFDAAKMKSDPEYASRIKIELDFLNNYLQLENTQNNEDPIKTVQEKLKVEKMNILDNTYVNLSRFSASVQKEYASKITRAMVLISDCFIDYQKANSRFNFLFEKYKQAKQTNSTESDEYKLLQYLIAFSGKALKGLDLATLVEVDGRYSNDQSIEPWDLYQNIVKSNQSNNSTIEQNTPLSLRSKIISNAAKKLSQI